MKRATFKHLLTHQWLCLRLQIGVQCLVWGSFDMLSWMADWTPRPQISLRQSDPMPPWALLLCVFAFNLYLYDFRCWLDASQRRLFPLFCMGWKHFVCCQCVLSALSWKKSNRNRKLPIVHLNKLGHVPPLIVTTKFTAAQKPCGGKTLAGSFWSPGTIGPNTPSFPPPDQETADQEAKECWFLAGQHSGAAVSTVATQQEGCMGSPWVLPPTVQWNPPGHSAWPTGVNVSVCVVVSPVMS